MTIEKHRVSQYRSLRVNDILFYLDQQIIILDLLL